MEAQKGTAPQRGQCLPGSSRSVFLRSRFVGKAEPDPVLIGNHLDMAAVEMVCDIGTDRILPEKKIESV